MTTRRVALLVLMLALSVGAAHETFAAGSAATQIAASPIVDRALAENKRSHAQADDVDYEPSSATRIALSGTSASVSGKGAGVNGSTVTISAAGTYLLSGRLTGKVVVDSKGDGKVRVVLDGASVTSRAGPALQITAADEAVIVLEGSSTNTLKDGAYAADLAVGSPNAALYSAADLTIGGTGSLSVEGGTYDGIASKDGLVVLGGRITVTAIDDGVRGSDYVIVQGGTLTVRSGGDGVRSESTQSADRGYVAVLGGSLAITGADGLVGATDVIVGGGTLRVTTSQAAAAKAAGGTSAKGLKAGAAIVIGGGAFTLDTVDDAVHSDGSITIARGTLSVDTDDDAVHAEKTLTITGGSLVVKRSREGLEASEMRLAGGRIVVRSSNDGLNLATGAGAAQGRGGELRRMPGGTLTITGGVITVAVDGDGDGVDVNGAIAMTGGTLVVSGSAASFNGALDADLGFRISGGMLVAAGSAGMAIAPDTSSRQGWVSVTFAQPVAARKVVQIVDRDKVLASYRTRRRTEVLVFSSSAIVSGRKYGVFVGGKLRGPVLAGFTRGGTTAGARRVATVAAGEHVGGRFGPGP